MMTERGRKRGLIATAALWAAISFTAGLLMIVAAPRLVGGQSMAVLSDSMSPAIETGDEVIVVPVDAAALEPGEIAVFNDPEGTGRVLQHRVQWVATDVDRVRLVTKGDANSRPERWSVPIGADVGQVVGAVPAAGFVLGRMDSPMLFVLLVAIPAVLLAVSLLISIWRAPEAGRPGQAAR